MRCYLIKETLVSFNVVEHGEPVEPYVMLLDEREWSTKSESLGWDIDLGLDMRNIHFTKAEVSHDILWGTFSIPRRWDLLGPDDVFSFVLHELGAVFIDGGERVRGILERIASTRKWRNPCMEHFLYDFLDQLIWDDLRVIEQLEQSLMEVEECVMSGKADLTSAQVGKVRSDIRVLRMHYGQLLDVAEVLEENENGFFGEEGLRYFKLFARKVERLRDSIAALHDYTIQVRDLYKTQLDVRQNSIVTLLTVVTAIFTPLTLLTGWFGMNFQHMPELSGRWSYAIVIVVSLVVVAAEVAYFKRRRWL